MADSKQNAMHSMYDVKRDYVLSRVSILGVYQRYLGSEFQFNKNAKCPFHEEENGSFNVNEKGLWHCFAGCQGENGKRGGDMIGFVRKIEKVDYKGCLDLLWDMFCEPRIPDVKVESLCNNWDQYVRKLGWLEKNRKISRKIIKEYRCGISNDGRFVMVPYYNEYGVCTHLLYLNLFKNDGIKSFSHKEKKTKYENGRLWPVNVVKNNKEIYMMEGHADTLCALSHGIPAVTLGAASYRIKPQDFRLLAGKKINIVYDLDDAGNRGAEHIAMELTQRGYTNVKKLTLPLDEIGGKDFTDWCMEGTGSLATLAELADETEPFTPSEQQIVVPVKEKTELGKASQITFPQISPKKYFKKKFRSTVKIAGVDTKPLSVPKNIEVECLSATMRCMKRGCSIANTPGKKVAITFEKDDPESINYMGLPNAQVGSVIRAQLGLKRSCQIRWDVTEVYSAYKVLMAEPSLYDPSRGKNRQVKKLAGVVLDPNVEANINYDIEGYFCSEPKVQQLVGVITDHERAEGGLDDFVVTKDVVDSLQVFHEFGADFDSLLGFYEHMSRTVTGIKGRAITHMAADLVFHSPVSFYFQGKLLPRTSLDVMIYGDTRCGKNEIVESLRRYYRVGELISSNNATLVGILGGITKQSGYRGPAWGVIPSRHRDTVVIDEVKSIDRDILGKLASLRGDGVAQIQKDGWNEKVAASVGILWLTNPRHRNRPMNTFVFGIDALRYIWGDNKDISRLDYAHAVATEDVESAIINNGTKLEGDCEFPPHLCNMLINWVKSRTPEQVRFTKLAEQEILDAALAFSELYSPKGNLVMSSDFRIKLAKVSAAVAGRAFNYLGADGKAGEEDGSMLVVDHVCVETAKKFFRAIYDSDTMAYLQFSLTDQRRKKFEEGLIKAYFETTALKRIPYIEILEFFLDLREITAYDIGVLLNDRMEGDSILSLLRQNGAIYNIRRSYAKTREFNRWLRHEWSREDMKRRDQENL